MIIEHASNINTIMYLMTYHCNLKCDYCFYRLGDPKYIGIKDVSKTELSTDEAINLIIEPVKKLNMKKIILSGGEPLLRKDIPTILRRIAELRIKCVIQTNLTLDIDWILGETEVLKNTFFQISLDGIGEEHDHFRGAGSYQKTIRNVRKIIQACREKNITPSIQTNSVLTKVNMYGIHKFVRNMIDEQISSCSFQLLTNNGIKRGEYFLTRSTLDDLFESRAQAERIARENNVELLFFPIDIKRENSEAIEAWYNTTKRMPWNGCKYIEKRVRVSPYGDVFSCVEKSLANVRDMSLSETLSSETYTRFIRKIKDSGPIPECLRCCNFHFQK